jgi:hypothetical protein
MPITLNHSNIGVQYSTGSNYIIENVKSDLYRDNIIANNIQAAPVIPSIYIENNNVYAVESYAYTGSANTADYVREFPKDTLCDILVVGGGGSGSEAHGGGGGAGAVIFMKNVTMNGNYTIKVGTGGVCEVTVGVNGRGKKGIDSEIFKTNNVNNKIIAEGGGGGGQLANANGGSGGSGGGGDAHSVAAGLGGAATPYTPILDGVTGIKYGNNGGNAFGAPGHGGGGGGAGGVGENALATYNTNTEQERAHGGVGIKSATINSVNYDFKTLFGTNTGGGVLESDGFLYFGGGGGNGRWSGPSYGSEGGNGGLGGGGKGGWATSTVSVQPLSGKGYPGINGTGGGGGGGGDNTPAGGNGGSGIVIIRYLVLNISSNLLTDEPVVIASAFTESIRTFTHSGGAETQTTHTITVGHNTICDILIVGGGGGGDREIGGGGGGGAVLYATNITIQAGTYQIKVGKGGAQNVNGSSSEAFGATCLGGGSTVYQGWSTGNGGTSGGSGSGGSANAPITAINNINGGGIGTSTKGTLLASGTLYNGNVGGNGSSSNNYHAGGGGGGAGTAGNNPNGNQITTRQSYINSGYPQKGGDGVPINITGTTYYWGAGGGGGSYDTHGGDGGLGGGGGGGASIQLAGLAGTGGINNGGNGVGQRIGAAPYEVGGFGAPNTGSGGGGGGYFGTASGGAGGSGIVIIKFKTIVSAGILDNTTHKRLDFAFDSLGFYFDATKSVEYQAQQKTGVGGWRIVRYLPPNLGRWYQGDYINTSTFNIPTIGTPYNYTNEWAVSFGTFDEMFFATFDMTYWLQCLKTSVLGSYSNGARPIIKSSFSSTPYTALWYNRATGAPEDPWIRIVQEDNSTVLYGENNNTDLSSLRNAYGGMCVLVRDSTSGTTISNPNQYTLNFPVPTLADINNNSNIILRGAYDIALSTTNAIITPKTGQYIPKPTTFVSDLLSIRYNILNPLNDPTGAQWAYNTSNMNVCRFGNVGIGTTNPEYTLDVSGSVNAKSYYLNGRQINEPLSELGLSEGMIAQVRHLTYTQMEVKNNLNWDAINDNLTTGFVIAITPKSNLSKILVNIIVHIGLVYTNSSMWWGIKLYRKIGTGDWTEVTGPNGTETGSAAATAGTPVWISNTMYGGDGDLIYKVTNVTGTYLDSPNTTSTVYYTAHWNQRLGDNPDYPTNTVIYLNRAESHGDAYRPAPSSSWTASEIWYG